MSRTDGHEPIWVQGMRDGEISHDHRFGECIIVDRKNLVHHFREYEKCAKYVLKEKVCVHEKGNKRTISGSVYPDIPSHIPRGSTKYKEITNDPRAWGIKYKTYWVTPEGNHCYEKQTHKVYYYEYDSSISCECDIAKRRDGCYRGLSYIQRKKLPNYKNKRHDLKNSVELPEKRRVKNSLKNIKECWNTDSPIGDDVYEDEYNHLNLQNHEPNWLY